MARESVPSSPNSRFRVWNAAGDLYSHVELAENWDTLDAIIGRPSDGSIWPPLDDRGVDGGIYALLKALEGGQDKVGSVKFMWWPSGAGDIADAVPDKWAVLAGQSIADGSHDFPVDGAVRLPNALNAFIIGADPAAAAGVEGVMNNLASGAPGVTQNVDGTNVGGGGSNRVSHTHTVSAHTHTIAAHKHTLPAHSHDMDHRHDLQEDVLTSGTPAHAIHAFHLKSSAIHRRWNLNTHNLGTLGYNPDSWPNETVTPHPGPGGSAAIVPHIQHTHFPRFWAGAPRVPGYTSAAGGGTRTTTGKAMLDTGNRSLTTNSGGDGSTSEQTLDNRPNFIALVPIVKVRN